VLHAHQVTSAGWLGAATGYHPFLVTSWGSDLLVGARRSLVQRQLARWVLARADYVTCVSGQLVEAARALGVAAERVELTPWGVDTTLFHPGAARQDRPPIVLSIRGLRPIYNPLVIAQAIPAVLARRPDTRFVIRTYSVDAELLAAFRDIVAQGGAAGAVEYVGDLPDDHAIADLYRQAAVAVSVPSSDGTPQSVLEAMACGAAPVLSDLPALRAWVQPDQEGLFVPAGDVAALAAAILRLLGDDTLRQSVQAAAVRLVQERADSRLWMQRYEQIYRQLAAGQRPRPPAFRPGEVA
jgi:glycosyltransferase involved in cell wall biosynthesis